ncbi:hypothetical protein GCK72_010531 [Caenorhabditis remanei]|uniref:GATOR2 complex protein WDR24 n=1 Tax=Caenorhabditis remanei TaxID=31234 RepID=A0A6A5H5G9_CAERE|nr:hypothetical protein GCK72_010531 [Caenorhabditis remanei]KAF1762269.1 hypothetical protein GCK72_010531 [Caenorhabditis remanei]
MQEPSPGNVQKKASSEILFADYGKNSTDGEDPTPENKRVIDLYDPVDAMSLNREKDRVVVSGIRGVLQIIKVQRNKDSDEIETPSIVKDLDMRVYRKGKINILYSAQNVKWNQLYDQYIATTSSNGSIVCWNVSRKNKSVFKAHERSATCLDWHATAPYILVSGSRDCTVKSYDMRVKDNHQLTFSDRNCESIRDVAMCKAPGFDDYFFTGDDGGVLRLWDLRQTRRWIFQKVAHRSFVSTLSLNPHNRQLLATGGGRDKMVKIWEWSGAELNRVSVVETTAPLGRVAWRPDKPYHLATCASVNETTVHVWDVRRPYLPYVTYDEHRDSVTDACWPTNDFDVFLTCGKDGLVVLHNIDSGHAPISYACDVAFDVTPDGTMGVAVNSEIHAKNDAELELNAIPLKGKKIIRQIPYESFNKPIKSLVCFGVPESLTHSLPPTIFYKIAEKYIIGGVEIIQLCETNSKTARKNGLEHVAQTWRLVEALCEQAKIQEEYDRLSVEEKERIIRAWAVRKKELAEEGRRWLANLNDHYRDDVKKQVTQRLENTQHVTAFLKFSSSSGSEASDNEKVGDTDNKRNEVDRMAPNFDRLLSKQKKRKKKNAAPIDFYFGAGEANFKGGKREHLHYNEFMGLRAEAYELRDEEKERRFFCKARKQPTNAQEYEEFLMQDSEADYQAWSPMLEIYRLLLYHAEQGDMQTCATVSMVCGKKLLDAVDPYTVNGWIKCYMEMLDRLELFLVTAKIRKYCTLDSISSVSRENTTIQLAHADCDALIVNGRCTKCEVLAQADCTVCRFAIVGMTYQCNLCGHCMHADHAYEWFQKSNSCAFRGCPCPCGGNTWPDGIRTFIGNDEVKKGHRKFNHLEQQVEPISNRVDVSRLDTDSEESPDEDLEWSPANNILKNKYGEVPCKDWNTEWAQQLLQMCSLRNMKPHEIAALEEEKEREREKSETEDENPHIWSPKTQKELDESDIRRTFMYRLEDDDREKKEVIESTPTEEEAYDVDREDFVWDFLASSSSEDEIVETESVVDQWPRLEQIPEEDEDFIEDEDGNEIRKVLPKEKEKKKPKLKPKPKKKGNEVARKRFVEKISNRSRGPEERPLVLFDEEMASMKEDKWDMLECDDYIHSIGHIGVPPQQFSAIYERKRRDNERVTSPTLTFAIRNHVKTKSGLYCSTSASETDVDEELGFEKRCCESRQNGTDGIVTEREGTVKPTLSYGERALKILSMSKKELKKLKAKKEKRRIDIIYGNIFGKSNQQTAELSPDEFIVSSSSDDSDSTNSSKSTTTVFSESSASELFIPVPEATPLNVNEGYKAESEDGFSSESTSHEQLSAEPTLRLPTPQATGDLYLKPESPKRVVVHKMKKYKKVRSALAYSVEDVGRYPDEHADNYFICINGAVPSPTQSRLSSPQVSPMQSIPSSRFSSELDPPPAPLTSIMAPSKKDSEVEKESEKLSESSEEHFDSGVQEHIHSAPPSRKTSSIITSDAPIIEPPAITSYANPIFSRITGRPRSRPVTICGSGYENVTSVNGSGMHSAPATNAVNQLFPPSSSLPTHSIFADSKNGDANVVETGNRHKLSVPSMPFAPQKKLSNGNQNNLLVTDCPPSSPNSRRENIYVGSESKMTGSHSSLSIHSKINGTENKIMQKQPEKGKKTTEASDSDLFSIEEDLFGSEGPSDEDNGEPFFPASEDIPVIRSTKHPWENEQQYQQRLLSEKEEEEEERREEEEKEREIEAQLAILNRHTPMMRELAKRKRRLLKPKIPPDRKPFTKAMTSLKRVKFTEEDYDVAMTVALGNLESDHPLKSDNSDFEEFVREQERCLPCQHEVKENKREKEYVNWLKNISEENQMFFAKSLSDPCAVFQLSHLEKTASHLIEFIKMFYFIKWEELLKIDNDFMLKEVYELWQDYRNKRPRVCRTHFRDYQFRFFASSIATKMKQHLITDESPTVKQGLLNYDWLHLKPCVNTLNDDLATIDDMMDTVVQRNPNWTTEEKAVANRYWDLFGDVPLHIETTDRVAVPPLSEDQLEIIDESNCWTKKMIKKALYKARKYDIKLTYTKQKKQKDMFYVQDRSEKVLNREWQMRLEKMVNETRHVDLAMSTFRINPNDKLIYTTDEHHPWPICQFDTGNHYVTVQPMVSRRYDQMKSRVRRKFTFRRTHKAVKNAKHIAITTDELRKLPSFKRFEPKLQKATEFKNMMSKHYKVVDRAIVENRHHLNTIVEEDDEVALIVQMLENRPFKSGKRRLDSEDVFAERREQIDYRDRDVLARMIAEKYRKQLEDYEKHEAAKMKIMKKHWMPELRRKIHVARRVIEIGRLMVEEDVRKWMEYQYELMFAKKTFRKNSYITKKLMSNNVPVEWLDSVDDIDFEEPFSPPVYAKPLTPVARYKWNPGPSAYNSSSDEEDYDPDDEKPEDDVFVTFETQPDLPVIAGKLQNIIKEKLELADDLVDDEWEYSDDSSVSTWFDNDTDDIVNRLINKDYVDEHIVLKERLKGPLGRKLWEVMAERQSPEPLSDEEENTSFDLMLRKDEEEKEKKQAEWMEENADLDDIGVSDGKTRKEVTKMETERDSLKYFKREDRKKEMDQIRWFFKKFALDHSYTSEPYVWNDELHEAIATMHRSELRRVGNRIHQNMKNDYELRMMQDDMVTEIIPADETSLQYKLINFLLFRNDGENFEKSSMRAADCSKMLKPIQQYEMFFGREGAYKLKSIGDDMLAYQDIRNSFKYLSRHWGDNRCISAEAVRRFVKVWWYNSKVTLQRFLSSCKETMETGGQIFDSMVHWYYNCQNRKIAQETFDQLEIGCLMNDILHTVDEYVEETEMLCRMTTSLEEKKAYSTMDYFDWYYFKHGYPDWYESEEDTESDSSASSVSEIIPITEDSKPNSLKANGLLSEDHASPIKIMPDQPRRASEIEEEEDHQSVNPFTRRRKSVLTGNPNKEMMDHYSKVYNKLKELEIEKRRKQEEEAAKLTVARWEQAEREKLWDIEDMEKKVHDFLMMNLSIKEKKGREDPDKIPYKDWRDVMENSEEDGYKDVPSCAMYGKSDMSTIKVLEMCGLPLSLDNQLFVMEMDECQSAATSVSDAEEIASVIEKDFVDDKFGTSPDIDDDAKSYSSTRHVLKHELHFQRDLECRRLPSCVLLFKPEEFFENPTDTTREFTKWKRIIEASECPFSFNKLVMRERLIQKCREECQYGLMERYFATNERNHKSVIEVFKNCFILVVVDTELKPWDCRVVSLDDLSKPAKDKISYLRKLMVEDSQEQLLKWLEINKIDTEVYSRCPVLIVTDENLTLSHATQMSEFLIEDRVKDEWLIIKREEGVRALDAIIRMPPPPSHKLEAYKVIFKPIYDAWYKVWSFENAQSNARTPVVRKFDPVKEYLHKARMIVNYAHQHYRMKRFDSLMSKDPTEFQLVDRSDVPSASLFDSLDAAVSKFCNEDSTHLDEPSKQVVKDTLIQLATGKIPYFTTNYFGGYDYTENLGLTTQEDEENDDDRLPILRNTDFVQPDTPNAKYLDMEDCEEEIEWLRNMYEESDFHRRRFMAVLMFELAQKAMFKFAPNMGDFEKAKNRFEHLLTMHAKQRPLLDMMITKVRGTYFMPLETNLFLYNSKLITFGELVDSEIHPEDWKNKKISFEDYRRQFPKEPHAMSDFLEMNENDSDTDSGSEVRSDTSSSLGSSTESLNSSKKARRTRKTINKAQRELMLMKLRSKPVNPDEVFALEKRALGPKKWKLRRRLNEYLESIADLDRNKLEAKLPAKKQDLLKYITDLIVNNSDTAHWSWGDLKMKTKVGLIPPVNRMRPKHFNRIMKGKKMYKPPKKYDLNDAQSNGRKWF